MIKILPIVTLLQLFLFIKYAPDGRGYLTPNDGLHDKFFHPDGLAFSCVIASLICAEMTGMSGRMRMSFLGEFAAVIFGMVMS